jgi:hypothetical protein
MSEVTLSEVPVWNLTLSAITQALCVVAIVVGSKANLRVRELQIAKAYF